MRGKGEQRGSVRRRNGAWHIAFSAWGQNSKGEFGYWPQERKITGSEKISKRQAQQAGYDEWVAPANGPAKCAQSQATLQQFVDVRFRPDHINTSLKKTGKAFYESILKNHILPGLGAVKLADISTQVIQSLISAKWEEGKSAQTLKHIRNCLSAIFKHAKALKFFHGDPPTLGVKLPYGMPKERGALTALQVQMLTEAMPERYRPLITVLAQTGLRIGEALGLRWKNVNLEDEWKISGNRAIPPNSMLICESFVRGSYSTLKTASSYRTIPLTSTAWVALVLHREREARRTFSEPSKTKRENISGKLRTVVRRPLIEANDPVFAARNGKPLDAHLIAARFLKTAGERIGCPLVSWHWLRHTFASRTDGFLTPAQKQAVLGHASTLMGLRYTHPELETTRSTLERTDERVM